MKIQIIGYSGAGKSTLAKALSEKYDLPLLYLDKIKFYDDWKEHSNEEITNEVQTFLDNNDSWVIDGNYSSICPERFSQCDIIIFLNYNRFYCFLKCFQRYLKYRSTPRESLGINDKFDSEFRRWILHDGRTKTRKIKHLNNLNKCQGTKLVFNNIHQLNRFLRSQNIEIINY